MYSAMTQLVGFLGTALCIGCYQFKSKQGLIICQMIGNILFVLHYVLLGEVSGCFIVMVTVVSSLVLTLQDYTWMKWKGWKWFFCGLLLAVELILWQQQFQIADVFGMISVMIFVLMTWSGDAQVVRKGKMLLQGPAFFIYSLLVGSYAGMLNEVIAITSAIIATLRFRKTNPLAQSEF